jgi:peroxiredoxin
MNKKEKPKKDTQWALKRGIDVVLISALIYAGLVMFGVVRQGSHFEQGTPAPDFNVMDIEKNQMLSLDSYKGKALLLNFFSTDCPSCKREIPDVEELMEQGRKRGLEVLLVSADEPQRLKQYLKERNSPLTAAYDPGKAHRAFGVDTIPYLVVIDPEGLVRADYVGHIKWTDIEPWLPASAN